MSAATVFGHDFVPPVSENEIIVGKDIPAGTVYRVEGTIVCVERSHDSHLFGDELQAFGFDTNHYRIVGSRKSTGAMIVESA